MRKAIALALVIFLNPYIAYAASLTFNADTTLTFTGLSNRNLVIESGSTADRIEQDTRNVFISLRPTDRIVFRDDSNLNIINFDTQESIVSECNSGNTKAILQGSKTITIAPTSNTRVCPSGGGLPSQTTQNQPTTQQPTTQQPTTQQPAEQPKVGAPIEKPVEAPKPAAPTVQEALVQLKDLQKDVEAAQAELKKLARDNKISAAEQERWSTALTGLNTALAAVGVTGEFTPTIKAKPKDVSAIAVRLETVVKAEVVLKQAEAALAEETGEVQKAKNNKDRFTALLKDKKIAKDEEKSARFALAELNALRKEASLKPVAWKLTKVTAGAIRVLTRALAENVRSQEQQVTNTQATVTKQTKKVATQRTDLQRRVNALVQAQ